MKKILLLLFLIIFGSANYAQSINMDSIFEPKLRGEIYQVRTGVEGKQFYNDDWVKSDIKLSSGEMVYNKLLKYNMLLDNVIWLQPDSFRMVKLEKYFIEELSLKNYKGKTVRFIRFRTKLTSMVDSADIFVEVPVKKAASLYIFRTVRIEGMTKNEDGVLYSYDKLIPAPVYFIKLPDGQTVTFRKIRKPVLLKVLPEKYKNSIRDIIQREHLSIRTEEDLAKLVGLIKE